MKQFLLALCLFISLGTGDIVLAQSCQPIITVIRHGEKIDSPYTLTPAGRAHAAAYATLLGQLTSLISSNRKAQGLSPICPFSYVMVPTNYKSGSIDKGSHSYFTAQEMQQHGAAVSIDNPIPNYSQLSKEQLRDQFYQVLKSHPGQSILVILAHGNSSMHDLTQKLNEDTNIARDDAASNNDTSSNFAAFHVFYPDVNFDHNNKLNYQFYLQMFKLQVDGQVEFVYPSKSNGISGDGSDKGIHSLDYYIKANDPSNPTDQNDLGHPGIMQTEVCSTNNDKHHTINSGQCYSG